MFGGLEIKGSAKKAKAPAAAAPADASEAPSSFSFLNSPAAPAAEPAPAAPSSGFSFLNPAEAAPAPPPAAPASSSGFSFMQEATPADPAAVPTEEASAEEPPAVKTTESADSTGLSGFSFMATPSSPKAAAAPISSEPVEEAPAAAPVADMSAFSFLDAPAPAAETPSPATPALDLVSAAMPTPAASTTTTTAPSSFAPAATSFAPAGAGVSFGGAAANTNRPKKKKNRATRVGMGAASAISSLPAPPPIVAEVPKQPSDGISRTDSNGNTRDEAAEAARRAEEFMIQKMQQQSESEREAQAAREKAAEEARKAAAAAPPVLAAKSSGGSGAYDDDIMAAAAAAAKEAQAMSKKPSTSSARGIMGGLFGRRASPPGSSSNLNSLGGSGGIIKPGGSRPPAPTPPAPTSAARASIDTSVAKPSSSTSVSSNDGAKAPVPPEVPTYQPSAVSSYQPATAPPATTKTFGSPPPLPPRPAAAFKPAAPPKVKTPQEKLTGMLQTFRQNVETSMARVTQLRQQRSELVKERHSALTHERLASQQLDLTEQQLTAAAEAEDFELADQLGSVLETYQKEQAECTRMLKHIDMAVQELDNQKQQVVDGVLQCFHSIKIQLETFESSEETKEHSSDDTAMKKFASMTKHLASEHERLQQDLKHLERDEGLVSEERKEVESAISEQSCQFEKDRDDAKARLITVEEEIEELRKKLKAKETEATQLRNDVAGHDDSILQVRVQFARQLQRVQKKETTVQDHRNEWETEKATFSAEKEKHEAEVAAHSEAVGAHEKLMASLKDEITLATVLEKIVQSEIGLEKSSDNGEAEEKDGELLGLQADVVKCEAAVSEASEVLKAATALLVSLEEEMGALIAKIPQLEAAKKEAASKRDFKAAGKASKEIKDATARVKDCQDELTGEAVARKDAAEADLKKLEAELSEKKKISLEKEKETGLISMKELANRVQHVVETKKQICGEDFEPDSMQGVGAFVLEEQIKSLVAEGKSYGGKYGGWEELIEGILPSADNSAASKPAEKAAASVASKKEAPSEPKQSQKERFASCRQLMQDLTDIEGKLNAAVDDEDYEAADELNETLQKLMAEVTALDLTDEETEQALAGAEGEEDEEAPVEAADEEPTTTAPRESEDTVEDVPTAEPDEVAGDGTPSAEEDAPTIVPAEDEPATEAVDVSAVEDSPSGDKEEPTDEVEAPVSGFSFLASPSSPAAAEDNERVAVEGAPSSDDPGKSEVEEEAEADGTSSVDPTTLQEEEAVTSTLPVDESVATDTGEEVPIEAAPGSPEEAVDANEDADTPPAIEEEESAVVSPNPSGEESLEPGSSSASKDGEVDEKKDAGDDGFVAVDDDDL